MQTESIKNHIINQIPILDALSLFLLLGQNQIRFSTIAYGSAFELTNKNAVLPDGYILWKLHKFDFWYLLVIE